VGVRREGIPDIVRFQRRQAHHELAALNPALMNEFVDGALVCSCLRAQVNRRRLSRLHRARRMRRMGRTGEQVELRRPAGILAANATDRVPMGR